MSLVYVEETLNPKPFSYYSCKIVIPSSDWERLESGPYEKYDVLTPYISWCHEHIGKWGQSRGPGRGWEIHHSVGFDEVYFEQKDDAIRFKLVWG